MSLKLLKGKKPPAEESSSDSEGENPYGVSSDSSAAESNDDASSVEEQQAQTGDAPLNVDFDIFPIEPDDGPYIRPFLANFLGNYPFNAAECAEYVATHQPSLGGVITVRST